MNITNLEANPRIRYGFSLRPLYAMSRAQCEMHDVLHRLFGLEARGKFMPHATIMSFFRSDASIDRIKAAIETSISGRQPFVVTNNGPKPHKRSGVFLNVHHDFDGSPNIAMRTCTMRHIRRSSRSCILNASLRSMAGQARTYGRI